MTPAAEGDLFAYARLWSDPLVMRYLPTGQPRPLENVRAEMKYVTAHWERCGCGIFSLRELNGGSFVGYCGVQHPHGLETESGKAWESAEFELLFGLAPSAWGQGYAYEAASAALRFGFEAAYLSQIAAAVVPENVASRRVLEKLGMQHTPEVQIYGEILHFSLKAEDFHPSGFEYRLEKG